MAGLIFPSWPVLELQSSKLEGGKKGGMTAFSLSLGSLVKGAPFRSCKRQAEGQTSPGGLQALGSMTTTPALPASTQARDAGGVPACIPATERQLHPCCSDSRLPSRGSICTARSGWHRAEEKQPKGVSWSGEVHTGAVGTGRMRHTIPNPRAMQAGSREDGKSIVPTEYRRAKQGRTGAAEGARGQGWGPPG